LKKENLTTGVPVGAVRISLFVMDHIKVQIISPSNLQQKKQIRCIYAVVKKLETSPFVTGLMQSCSEWDGRYKQGQTGWDRGEASPSLNYWLEREFLKPCRILIPGCGNGYEVLELAEKGFDVVAIDIAPTPIENLGKTLQARQSSAELIQTDFLAWEYGEPFDAIYEQTSLCALHPDKWQIYEKCLYDWLKPKGKLFAQFMQTGNEGGPPFHCEISDMTDLFAAERWLWSNQHQTQVVHTEGLYEKVFLLEKI
jgi:SAM-dependent methyltransferase